MSPRWAILIALVAMGYGQHISGAILSRAVDLQRAVVEREEQLLDKARESVRDAAERALVSSRDAVMNVAEQLHYVSTFPLRVAAEALKKPKLVAVQVSDRLQKYSPFHGESDVAIGIKEDDVELQGKLLALYKRLPQVLSSVPVLGPLLSRLTDASNLDKVQLSSVTYSDVDRAPIVHEKHVEDYTKNVLIATPSTIDIRQL